MAPDGCGFAAGISSRDVSALTTFPLALFALAMIVLAASVFNVTRAVQLSRSDARLKTDASRDEARAAGLHDAAARLRATVDPRQIEYISAEARRANNLIEYPAFETAYERLARRNPRFNLS